jgi:hypothetical protein
MNTAELDRLWQRERKIVSAEITSGPGPLPQGVFDQAPRVIVTLDDGCQIELFSFFSSTNWRRQRPPARRRVEIDDGHLRTACGIVRGVR